MANSQKLSEELHTCARSNTLEKQIRSFETNQPKPQMDISLNTINSKSGELRNTPLSINNSENSRRPNVCITEKYVQQMNNNLPIRPGVKSYSKAASNTKLISVVTDSMCRSIRNQHINSFVDQNVETLKFNKFPGAHARQIKHYSTWTITNDQPESIVIVAGANDLN